MTIKAVPLIAGSSW